MALDAFTDAIRSIVAGLREGRPTHARVNGAAAGIDHLGRRLHGLGCVRDREIASCFTAAVGALGACHPLPEEDRGDAVDSAIRHLHAALVHADEGLRPFDSGDKQPLGSREGVAKPPTRVTS